ncbi:Utp21 specific WD40 associated putative domain-containing protein [Ephemerocybe angulata]|uniref:Utp21 specific WD40 associated putative domain-containing protein n=1 Tax=Ephemerocybe angulata TaxID=980116 RepID=A0A8H6IE68_9AGAR|nr:Utp21 specific WD40 associated putative domain-containing protein [Tulosesus angulatus]
MPSRDSIAATDDSTSDVSTPPPRKRLRQDSSSKVQQHNAAAKNEPRLFVPFRALGLITNHIPFALQTRSFKGAAEGPRVHLLTCLGRSWALWEGGKMTLLFVGPDAPDQITSMAMDGDAVWVAASTFLIKYIRGKEILRIENPLGSNLAYVTIFGSFILALTEQGDRMLTWDTTSGALQSTIEFEKGFTATSILHPATYLNKVLIASNEGNMELWNIQTQKRIFHFASSKLLTAPTVPLLGKTFEPGSAITSVVQSPAIDVVGIGFHIWRDLGILIWREVESGPLGFRGDGQPILASASSAGHLALWDLNAGGRLLHMVRGAHDGAISALEWVPGQPLLITSGEDNSVKQWVFDSPTAAPRLLKFRSGHHSPPHLIRYYGDDGKQLLTASRDRSLRCTSVVRDSRSFELSQGSLAKKATSLSLPVASLKFPPITSLSYSPARAKDWDDILTAHADETFARTWTMQSKRLGKYTLGFADDDSAASKIKAELKGKGKATLGSVKSTCVTACGNFGVAGSSTGSIHMWNMQSGMRRRTFKLPACPAEVAGRVHSANAGAGGKASGARERSVVGLATDTLNQWLVACTLDGTLNFYDFRTAVCEATLVLPSTATGVVLQRESGLLAVVCDDLVVRVVDLETRKVVREMGGFRGRVLDIAFSPDSRWLVTSSLDSVIRTFDVPTGQLIDAFKTSSVATSLSFSPTNDFLATSHIDSLGVFLWANRAQYADITFKGIQDDEIAEVSLPSVQGTSEEEALEALAALKVNDSPADVFSTPPQLDGELITLTLLPRSRWQTLLNLEVIQQRNKPKEAPKAPEHAPFFLPTLPGVETRFAIDTEKKEREAAAARASSRRLQKKGDVESVFYEKMAAAAPDSDYEDLFTYAKAMSPAALDLEIRSLMSLESLALFMHALTQRLRSRRDFEAVEAFLKVFLQMHSEVLIANEELREAMEEMEGVHRKESQRVLELITSSLGTLGFVRDTL